MCRWNCEKLAEAIRMAVPLTQTTPKLAVFDSEYARHYLSKMRAKLGQLKCMPVLYFHAEFRMLCQVCCTRLQRKILLIAH